MAEKKKLTTAEILAMARKHDAGAGAAKSPEAAPEPSAPPPPEPTAAETPSATPPEAPAKPKPAKPAAASSGGRPSVAEMLAAARATAGKPGEESPAPQAKESPKPAAAKPQPKPASAEKSAATPKEKPAAGAPKDTSSILAEARKTARSGPMNKATAAAAAATAAKPAAPVKAKVELAPPPPKPEYAKPDNAKRAKSAPAGDTRRGFLHVMFGSFFAIGSTALAVVGGLWTLGLARFMFPNILTEPPSKFKVGFPEAFAPGAVEEKYKAQFGVWIVNGEYNGQQQLYALKTVCTHLGCTPNWLEAEQKFKCPCHGSGFYKDGINFEGPAPRPLERYAVRLADDGQVEIDRSKIFQEEMGQWGDTSSFIPRTA